MGWYVFQVMLFATPMVALIGVIIVWRRRGTSPSILPLVLICLCSGIWGVCYGLELLSPSLSEKVAWAQARFLGVAFLPFVIAIFLLRMAGWRSWPDRKMGLFLLSLSIVNLLGAWTNQWHHLFWVKPRLVDYGLYTVLHVERGLWFWFQTFHSYGLITAAMAAALTQGSRASGLTPRRLVWLFTGIVFAICVNLFSLAGLSWLPGIDLSPVGFAIAAVVFSFGANVDSLFQANPLAHTTLIKHLRDGVLVLDTNGKILDLNQAANWLLGLSRSDVLNRNLADLEHPLLNAVAHLLAGDTGPQEIARDIDGYTRWFEYSLVPLYEEHSNDTHPKVGSMVIWHEITYQKEIEEELRYTNTHDQLTGLHNRLMFQENYDRLCRGRNWPVAIILADLDNMKFTNDTLGHASGDELLRQAARLLESSIRADDMLARIGGDEFAALLPGADDKVAMAVVERLGSASGRYNEDHTQLRVELSLGWAIATSGIEMESAFHAADQAMYAEKALHKLKRDTARTRPLPPSQDAM